MSVPKVALITGASRGVGAAVARAFAAQGDTRVVINYHSNASAASQLVDELSGIRPASSNGTSADSTPWFVALQADTSNRAQMTSLVQQTIDQMGRLDIVVSNVGWTRMTDFMNLDHADDEADWDRCFDVNVKSHFRLFRACQTHLERSEGVFIATASVAGVKPSGSSLVCLYRFFYHALGANNQVAIRRDKGGAHSPGQESRDHRRPENPCELGSTWCAHDSMSTPRIEASANQAKDWGRGFPTEKIKAVEKKNVLKRLATPEVRLVN
jgi:NAD(P)-dependent dehydrogenase (short-subunit alcohol dehydrogenase family)